MNNPIKFGNGVSHANEYYRPKPAMREKASPVGTRGGVEWMRGPGACPRRNATIMVHATQANRAAGRTSTRPPPLPASALCPYRTRTPRLHSPIRSSQFIRTEARLLPDSVAKVHQDVMPRPLLPRSGVTIHLNPDGLADARFLIFTKEGQIA